MLGIPIGEPRLNTLNYTAKLLRKYAQEKHSLRF